MPDASFRRSFERGFKIGFGLAALTTCGGLIEKKSFGSSYFPILSLVASIPYAVYTNLNSDIGKTLGMAAGVGAGGIFGFMMDNFTLYDNTTPRHNPN